MKVLVTGATGRLGKYVIPALLERKHELRLCVKNAEDAREAFPKAQFELMELDLLEAQESAFETVTKGVDAIVHLAALISYAAKDKKKIFDLNAEVTRKLASAAKKNGVKRFVFMSSTSLYHKPKAQPITEAEEPSPDNAYGKSKVLAEKYLRENGVPFVILRAALIYGPGFEEGFLTTAKMVKKGRMPVIGSGKNVIALVHAQDVAEAIALALEKKEAVNQDFNISGPSLSERDLLNALAEELGVKPPRFSIPVFTAYAFASMGFAQKLFFGKRVLYPDYVRTFTETREFDCSKAKRLLGWEARVNARDGISEVVASMLSKL